jgi:hypothetical protein
MPVILHEEIPHTYIHLLLGVCAQHIQIGHLGSTSNPNLVSFKVSHNSHMLYLGWLCGLIRRSKSHHKDGPTCKCFWLTWHFLLPGIVTCALGRPNCCWFMCWRIHWKPSQSLLESDGTTSPSVKLLHMYNRVVIIKVPNHRHCATSNRAQ